MGQEERLALRKKPRIEDAIIGVFVVFALLYPLLVIYIIQKEEKPYTSDELNAMRDAYLFITGLEDCSPQTASRIANYMEEALLHRLGGISGLVKMCRENRERIKGTVAVEEKVERSRNLIILKAKITLREKGIPREKLKVEVFGYKDGNFRITDLSYAQGS